ncbi:MAG: acyl-CoA dehydrogenase family protein, partial [Deltaproteobacteria bacterium]|nr:acyl-CoA dehydrogenase family protein [Deltaproteobacteria bacterium]
MAAQSNPLIDDSFVDFLLYSVLDAESLCELEAYQQHSKETFDLYLDSLRRFARQDLLPTYKPMDEEPPVFRDGRIHTHPALPRLFEQMVELGVLTASRPESVGGQQMPMLVNTLSSAYLMAANLSAYGFIGLTRGAAHLIEAFGTDEVKERFMTKMYEGEWTGTMALTEPQAGSSLGEIATSATPTDDGHYLIKGSKIFISGADHSITENVVNLALARIDGAPDGTKGISLFAVPRLREEGGSLVSNDVAVAGMIHKIGWKGLPSLAIEFGDEGDCHGWLVGEPNQGLHHMFQMMNAARISVGVNAASTASAAYHESLAYALERKQGRKLGTQGGEQVSIIEHADVRRMLLRQKAIVEGSLALLGTVSRYSDISEHGTSEEARER